MDMKNNFMQKLLSVILSAAILLNSGTMAFAVEGTDGRAITDTGKTSTEMANPSETPPNGANPNETPSGETPSNGANPNGATSNGANPNGATPNGATPNETTPGVLIAPDPTSDRINIKVDNGTGGSAVAGGDTLQAAVEQSGSAASIKTLTITNGEVTAADWAYFAGGKPGETDSPFTTLTDFTVAPAVTAVADIPSGNPNSIFPKSIVTVTIPQAIEMGWATFRNCSKLTTATFDGATSIGAEAFHYCGALKNTSFPKVMTIGKEAFYGSSSLTSVSFPEATTIGVSAFYSTGLTSASFPKATTIGAEAFTSNPKFANLKLGATPPTSVGEYAFHGCRKDTLMLVDASGTDLAGTELTTAQAAYDAVLDGETGSTDIDGKWYGWKVREPIACTCTLSAPTFIDDSIKIPDNQASATHTLSASGPVLGGGCAIPGHSTEPVIYSFAEKTDTKNIATVSGTTLTVN
ncbi:MAG: leucine-rich repeat domain-containing protein, partial [Oscillospiraceae bacterium]